VFDIAPVVECEQKKQQLLIFQSLEINATRPSASPLQDVL
jgi:hypothetical protein